MEMKKGIAEQLGRQSVSKQTNLHSTYAGQQRSSRSSWLDVLKGLAMLGVILVHFNNAWSSPISFASKISAIGARCPQLFFIISAYLTWATISRRNVRWTDFYKKRFIRIAPIFYVALVLAALIPVLMSVSIGNWISHFLFINGLVPEWTNSIMGLEWYIADLTLFYMLVPLLQKIIRGLKSSLVAFVVSAVLSSASLVTYNMIGPSETLSTQMYFETFFILHQLPVMILGIILYYLIREIDGKGVRKVLAETGVVVAIIGMIFIALHLNKRYVTSSLIAGLTFAWLFLAFWSVRSVLEHRAMKPLGFIGAHSFGIYCFHQIIINCVLKVVPHNGAGLWISRLLLVIMISIGIGFGAEKAQETIIR